MSFHGRKVILIILANVCTKGSTNLNPPNPRYDFHINLKNSNYTIITNLPYTDPPHIGLHPCTIMHTLHPKTTYSSSIRASP